MRINLCYHSCLILIVTLIFINFIAPYSFLSFLTCISIFHKLFSYLKKLPTLQTEGRENWTENYIGRYLNSKVFKALSLLHWLKNFRYFYSISIGWFNLAMSKLLTKYFNLGTKGVVMFVIIGYIRIRLLILVYL